MELNLGFVPTECGLIPSDWSIKRVGEITDVKTGPFGSALHERDYVTHGTPIITVEHLGEHGICHINLPLVSEFDKDRLKAYSLRQGDIVFSRVGAIDRNALITFQENGWLFSGRLLRVRIQKDYIDPSYLSYHFHTEGFRNRVKTLAVGQTMASINTRILSEIKTIIPPLAEQQAIAEALGDVDALIESLEQLIAKKRLIKQGVMRELLEPKPGWVISKLEDIADVIDPHPSHRAPIEVPSGIPFVGIGDLKENGEIDVTKKLRMVDSSVFDEHQARYNLSDELIGLGRVASIGKVVNIKNSGSKFVISPTLGIIKGRIVKRDYLFFALKSRYISNQFNRIMSGSTRSSVGMLVLRKLDISFPKSETERDQIALTLIDIDAEIAELEMKLRKTNLIKQGMMQELLTGRIRLI